MKKLIYPALFAFIAIAVSSCSKTTNDLVVNQNQPENQMKKESRLPDLVINTSSADLEYVEGEVSFHPFITQPINLKLGDLYYTLAPGSTAVFYVVLKGAFANNPPSSATITTTDAANGDVIDEYGLISSDQAEAYGVLVPEELVGQSFMFAIVDLKDPYFEKTITLHSAITVDGANAVAILENAFIVGVPG